MAWGNFCSLPCPLKRWDNRAKSLMLGFLPSVGLIIGLLWAAIYFALVYLGFPYLPIVFMVTFLPFALCGFIHLDGFMDCSDAIMSRRPLEERQRILKDSHTGAFAVVSLIFLLLAYYSCVSTAVGVGIDFVNMVMIVVLSRSVSGIHVLLCKPMKQSQYAQMSEDTDSSATAEAAAASKNPAEQPQEAAAVAEMVEELMDETVLAEFAEASYAQKNSDKDAVRPAPSSDAAERLEAVSEELKDVTREIAENAEVMSAQPSPADTETETSSDGTSGGGIVVSAGNADSAAAVIKKNTQSSRQQAAKNADVPATKKQGLVLLLIQLVIYFALALLCSHYIPATLLVSAFVTAGTALAILHGRRQLGGMSGDIAGYGIVWGELMGVIGLLFC